MHIYQIGHFFSMFTILPMFFEYVPIKFVDVSSKPTLCILLNLIYMGLLTGKCSWQCLPPPPKIQQWNTKKRCWILSKLTMKTPEECQCFLMSPCQWGPSGRYRCVWICFNIKQSTQWGEQVYLLLSYCYTEHNGQCFSELAFRSTDFHITENPIFPVLFSV